MTRQRTSAESKDEIYYQKMADHSFETAKFLIALYTTVAGIYLTGMVAYVTFRASSLGANAPIIWWNWGVLVCSICFMFSTLLFRRGFMHMLQTYERSMNLLGEQRHHEILNMSIGSMKSLNAYAFGVIAMLNGIGTFLVLYL